MRPLSQLLYLRHAWDERAADQAVAIEWLAAPLAVASLVFWFVIGFPWQHHNESLVWAIDLQRVSFWKTLWTNPVATVQTYRPLGIAVAWLTFHATGGGLWLQQVLNLAFTACAWIIATRSVPDPRAFAWVSFLVGGAYFSGYIFLFHLHGVFYGPLLVFLGWLLLHDSYQPQLTARRVGLLFLAALLAASFHTFAWLLLGAYLVARGVEDTLARRRVHWVAIGIAVVMAALCSVLSVRLVIGHESAVGALLTSYRAMEPNLAVSAVSALLAGLAGWSVARPHRTVQGLAVVLLALAALLAHVPVLPVWILVCIVNALRTRRLALAALAGICALLPAINPTGSPTYAVFVLMPCVTITAMEMDPRIAPAFERLLVPPAIASLIVVLVALKLGAVPALERFSKPLLAEREKTEQLKRIVVWLDAHPKLRGQLSLCQPSDFPVHGSAAALERQFRAPVDAYSFGYYVHARYGDRFDGAAPTAYGEGPVVICFGGDSRSGVSLLSVPGRWAGEASVQRLAPTG